MPSPALRDSRWGKSRLRPRCFHRCRHRCDADGFARLDVIQRSLRKAGGFFRGGGRAVASLHLRQPRPAHAVHPRVRSDLKSARHRATSGTRSTSPGRNARKECSWTGGRQRHKVFYWLSQVARRPAVEPLGDPISETCIRGQYHRQNPRKATNFASAGVIAGLINNLDRAASA
jgi:hypothetical protein